jgi:RimJ/RimL family protein N-acetyltransferase
MATPQPVALENNHVSLKPLSLDHAEAFLDIGQNEDIWTYLAPAPFKVLEDAQSWIRSMLARSEDNGDVTFSVFDKSSRKLAGSSSYIDVRTAHGGLEIGFTWYGKEFQRTHVNTATKLALFTHAFETLGANRVQLQTDARNHKSQSAIARIGATQEGVLRKHKVYPDGYVRDSVMFSVIAQEWPQVKGQLQKLLTQYQ